MLVALCLVVCSSSCSKSDDGYNPYDYDYSDNNGGNNSSGGGTNPSGGGTNNGGNNGNNTLNPLDFDFAISFNVYIYAFDEGHGTYERSMEMLFSTPEGLYSRGITEFAIGIQSLDGSIYYKQGFNTLDSNVYVKKEGNTVWYTGTIYNDSKYTWIPYILMQHQSSPTTKFKWTYRVKCNGTYYGGEHWTTEEYSGEIGSEF